MEHGSFVRLLADEKRRSGSKRSRLLATWQRRPAAGDVSNLCKLFSQLSIRKHNVDVKSVKIVPSSKHSSVGFLDLPGEVRNIAYELALIRHNGRYDVKQFYKSLEPMLLLVHSVVRFEATPIFYGRNRFVAKNLRHALPWIRQIGPQRRAMVESVHIRFYMQPWLYKERFRSEWPKAGIVLQHDLDIPADSFLAVRQLGPRTVFVWTNGGRLVEHRENKTGSKRKMIDAFGSQTTEEFDFYFRFTANGLRYPLRREASRVKVTYVSDQQSDRYGAGTPEETIVSAGASFTGGASYKQR